MQEIRVNIRRGDNLWFADSEDWPACKLANGRLPALVMEILGAAQYAFNQPDFDGEKVTLVIAVPFYEGDPHPGGDGYEYRSLDPNERKVPTMTPQEAAAALNGNQYAQEGSKELWAAMKAAGLVAVFGASDDLVELEGAIHDELGAFQGTTFFVDGNGLVKNDCECGSNCPNWTQRGTPVKALWGPEGIEGDPSWAFATEIPHVTFDIMEDDEFYCRGIVFALKDAG